MSQFQLSVCNLAELRSRLGSTGLEVSPRPLRSNLERELYCLRRYLLTLAGEELLGFPFEVEKSTANQAPDFIFAWAGVAQFGLEVSEATNEPDQREMDAAQEHAAPFYYDGQFGGAGNGGFVGTQPEQLWLSYVVGAIMRKKNKAYETTTTRILLYSNSNAGGHVDAADAVRIIGEYARSNAELFRMNDSALGVSILKGDRLLHDIGGDLKFLPVISQ